jgi:hypothetical protein
MLQPLTISVPTLKMPPPYCGAKLLEVVQSLIVSVAKLRMAPPSPDLALPPATPKPS